VREAARLRGSSGLRLISDRDQSRPRGADRGVARDAHRQPPTARSRSSRVTTGCYRDGAGTSTATYLRRLTRCGRVQLTSRHIVGLPRLRTRSAFEQTLATGRVAGRKPRCSVPLRAAARNGDRGDDPGLRPQSSRSEGRALRSASRPSLCSAEEANRRRRLGLSTGPGRGSATTTRLVSSIACGELVAVRRRTRDGGGDPSEAAEGVPVLQQRPTGWRTCTARGVLAINDIQPSALCTSSSCPGTTSSTVSATSGEFSAGERSDGSNSSRDGG